MMDETPYFRRKYAFIIHWTHYLFSDWPKTYGEFSKSAPVTCQTLKVTRNHVMYDRYALRVFMSSLCALYCLPTVEKHKHEFHFNFRSMYNKTIRFGFCDIQNNQGLDKDYQPQPSAENPYLDLIILVNTKSSSNNSFFEHTKCDFFLVNSHRLDFRRSLVSGLRSSPKSAGSFPKQRLVIEPTTATG